MRIRVVDRGLGIDADDLPHIFKPFYRGRRAVEAQVRGTGVGLSVVRHVVDAHRGQVTIDEPSRRRHHGRRSPAGVRHFQQAVTIPRVLVVEDEAGLRLTLTDRLVSEGYAVETADDGEPRRSTVRRGRVRSDRPRRDAAADERLRRAAARCTARASRRRS